VTEELAAELFRLPMMATFEAFQRDVQPRKPLRAIHDPLSMMPFAAALSAGSINGTLPRLRPGARHRWHRQAVPQEAASGREIWQLLGGR
jgi:hypothetical protein